MSHVAVLEAAVSFATARIIMNHMFEDELDAIRDRAVVKPTAFLSFLAVSF